MKIKVTSNSCGSFQYKEAKTMEQLDIIDFIEEQEGKDGNI
jgi:hypothetical protein